MRARPISCKAPFRMSNSATGALFARATLQAAGTKKVLAVNRPNLGENDVGDERSGKSMLEQIIDTTPILINATDRNGKFLFLNSYQAALFGQDPDQLVVGRFPRSWRPTLWSAKSPQNVILETGISIPNYEEKFISEGLNLSSIATNRRCSIRTTRPLASLTTGLGHYRAQICRRAQNASRPA